MQSMAQGLYLSQRMALQQVLAPQLQQSLALLQAPTLELQAMVQQELANNVTLEEIPAESEHEEKETLNGEEAPADPAEPPADLTFESAAERPMVSQPMIFRRRSKSCCRSTRNGAIIIPRPTCRSG
jgi:DNA-directed RNA polymerase specialized sigma54-like protein